ncbi:MAG: hemerythrin domain-containing protein [Flavobacteriales bacterium]|nr:hemerythrin domain-containing protein [Flavobacteriales bacterium]
MKENNPLQTLMDEHDLICSTEDIIKSLNGTWVENPDLYTERVNSLLIFFKEYSDLFHHRKEEEILFRELRDHPDFLLNDILTELEEHHESFRETVLELDDAIENSEYEKVQSLFAGYLNDLLDHIAVENDELFSMAESVFTEDELERMYFLFQDLEMDLGQDRKRELEESLKALV